jgi:hypothetical protein
VSNGVRRSIQRGDPFKQEVREPPSGAATVIRILVDSVLYQSVTLTHTSIVCDLHYIAACDWDEQTIPSDWDDNAAVRARLQQLVALQDAIDLAPYVLLLVVVAGPVTHPSSTVRSTFWFAPAARSLNSWI